MAIIDAHKEPEVTIYPNPAHDILKIHYKSNSAKPAYTISDIRGSTVMAGNLDHSTPNTLLIRDLKPGMYFIQITDWHNLISRKFVKAD
jgi:hypothetical protein